MSATSRTIPADAGIGQLAIVFAALLVGVALMAALAYGPLAASQVSVAPAAAPAPAVTHDHGWSSSSLRTAPAGRDSGWIDTTPILPVPRDSGWIDTTPILPAADGNTFDKAHAPGAASQGPEERGFGSNPVRRAQ